jgi:hypothetical protein
MIFKKTVFRIVRKLKKNRSHLIRIVRVILSPLVVVIICVLVWIRIIVVVVVDVLVLVVVRVVVVVLFSVVVAVVVVVRLLVAGRLVNWRPSQNNLQNPENKK